jgi:hypothetical protein
MPTSRSSSPLIGVNTADIWSSTDAGYTQLPLGSVTVGANGHKYILVQASAGIATGDSTPVVVIVTEPGLTAATGAGAYQHRGVAVTTGQRFWVEQTLL